MKKSWMVKRQLQFQRRAQKEEGPFLSQPKWRHDSRRSLNQRRMRMMRILKVRRLFYQFFFVVIELSCNLPSIRGTGQLWYIMKYENNSIIKIITTMESLKAFMETTVPMISSQLGHNLMWCRQPFIHGGLHHRLSWRNSFIKDLKMSQNWLITKSTGKNYNL